MPLVSPGRTKFFKYWNNYSINRSVNKNLVNSQYLYTPWELNFDITVMSKTWTVHDINYFTTPNCNTFFNLNNMHRLHQTGHIIYSSDVIISSTNSKFLKITMKLNLTNLELLLCTAGSLSSNAYHFTNEINGLFKDSKFTEENVEIFPKDIKINLLEHNAIYISRH